MRVVSIDLWEDAGPDSKVGCTTSDLEGIEWMGEDPCFGQGFRLLVQEGRVKNTLFVI